MDCRVKPGNDGVAMAEESAKLRIPYIAAAQAQKHVTHNEAMTLLDTLVQLSVLDKDLTVPPGSPAEGDAYIVASGATGAWLGWDNRVARYIDGEWRSYLPGSGAGAGWLAWVLDEDAMYRFDGAAWALAGIEGPPGEEGPSGDDGQSFQPDAVVALIAGRDAYDDEAAAFSVLVVSDATNSDQPTLYFKLSAGSADWSGGITWVPEGGSGGGTGTNRLINPSGAVAQRGTTFTAATTPANNDDTWLLDRKLLLSDGNDILDVSKETSVVPTDSASAIKLDVETANKRAGIAEIVEGGGCLDMIGGVASVSLKARKGASNVTVDQIRVVIASWTGTADAVTSDMISAWNAEGADPTLAANWTLEGSAVFTLTDAYQTFALENVALDASGVKNVAVLVMIENDDGTVGDLVYLTDLKLESGPAATAFEPRLFAEDLALCQRYCEIVESATGLEIYGAGQAASATRALGFYGFKTQKRAAPTVTISAAGHWAFYNPAVNAFVTWVTVSPQLSAFGCLFDVSGMAAALGGAGTCALWGPNSTTAAKMTFDAEL